MSFVVVPIQKNGANFIQIGQYNLPKYGKYLIGRNGINNFVYIVPLSIAGKYELYDTQGHKLGLVDKSVSEVHLLIEYTGGTFGGHQKLRISSARNRRITGTDLSNNAALSFMPGNLPQEFSNTTLRLRIGDNTLVHLMIQ